VLLLPVSERKPDSEELGKSALPDERLTMPELIIDRVKNELTFIDQTGKPLSVKTRIVEVPDEDADETPLPPMAVEDFEKALRAVDSLGLAWTADSTPAVKVKNAGAEDALISEEFEKLQVEYPRLPYEVFLATSYFLTGSKVYAQASGGEENLKKKAVIAGEIVVDADYRNQFFFRSAIKVPYLRDIDWEIVIKLHERGVQGTAGIPYGLLALKLQDPFYSSRTGNLRHITVAVDEALVNNLLGILTEVQSRLASARRQTDILTNQQLLEEQDDNNNS
jgi:hypothetical protein